MGKGDVLSIFPLVKLERRRKKEKKKLRGVIFSQPFFNHYECVRRPETALKCIEYERGGAKKRGGKKRERERKDGTRINSAGMKVTAVNA